MGKQDNRVWNCNVNRRIKLYYGEEYGLILESEPDIGTKVIVVVPKNRQAEKK